jgi:hypothetical protein
LRAGSFADGGRGALRHQESRGKAGVVGLGERLRRDPTDGQELDGVVLLDVRQAEPDGTFSPR